MILDINKIAAIAYLVAEPKRLQDLEKLFTSLFPFLKPAQLDDEKFKKIAQQIEGKALILDLGKIQKDFGKNKKR